MQDRIKELLDEKGIGPAQFADEIEVPRATISHILNGRNKASLDVVTKVVQRYPEVSLQWLVLGKGDKFNSATPQAATPVSPETKPIEQIVVFYTDKTFKVYRPQ